MTIDSPETIKSVIAQVQRVAAKFGFKNPDIKFPYDCNDDGYTSLTNDVLLQDGGKELKLFAKVATTDENFRRTMSLRLLFLQEIYFYEDVYPTLSAFYHEKTSRPLKIAPDMYRTSSQEKKEMLLMENLKQEFTLAKFGAPMNDKLLAIGMKCYAKLHATSFALRDQKPKVFQNLVEHMPKIMCQLNETSKMAQYIINGIDKVIACFDETTESIVIKKLYNFKNKVQDLMKIEVHTPPEYSVFIHGDCWLTNMMFKFKDENALEVVDMRLLDFQIFRLESPVLDLSYFFYANASKLDLNIHDNYIKLYHDTLSTYLKELGSDPEKLYPFEVFKAHWKKYASVGMLYLFPGFHTFLTETDPTKLVKAIKEGKDMGNCYDDEPISEKLKERVRAFIINVVQNEYI